MISGLHSRAEIERTNKSDCTDRRTHARRIAARTICEDFEDFDAFADVLPLYPSHYRVLVLSSSSVFCTLQISSANPPICLFPFRLSASSSFLCEIQCPVGITAVPFSLVRCFRTRSINISVISLLPGSCDLTAMTLAMKVENYSEITSETRLQRDRWSLAHSANFHDFHESGQRVARARGNSRRRENFSSEPVRFESSNVSHLALCVSDSKVRSALHRRANYRSRRELLA